MYSSAIFLLSFAVFTLTSAPLITTGDSGELVAAAFTLGIPHPPGYPLYVMLGKAFSFLPFGNVASRLNMMSSVFVSLSALLIYRTACIMTDRESSAPAAAVAASFALTGIAWSQATYSEVYPLQVFVSASVLYSLAMAVKLADFRYALAASFLAGMSLTGHYAGIMFIPAVLFYALYTDRIKWSLPRVAYTLISFLFGLTPFLFIYVRTMADPAVNWGNPDNLERFVAHITRSSYGDVGAMAASLTGGLTGIAAALAGVVLVAVAVLIARARYGVSWSRLAALSVLTVSLVIAAYVSSKGVTPEKVNYFRDTAVSGGIALVMPLAVTGMWAVFRRDPGISFFLVVLITVAASITLYRVPVTWSFNFLSLSDKFFMPLSLSVYLAAAAGAVYAGDFIGGRGIKAAYISLAFLVLPGYLMASGYGPMDQSDNYVAHDFATALMETPEQGSLFLVNGDNHIYLTVYKKYVEMARPDVYVFTMAGPLFPTEREPAVVRADRRRPVYSSTDDYRGVALEPVGILSRFPNPFAGPPPGIWDYYNIRVDESRLKYTTFESREVLAEYYFTQARQKMLEGDREEMMRLLEKTAETGWDVMWANIAVSGLFMEYGYMDKAYKQLRHALDVAPLNPEAHMELGKYYMLAGKPDDADTVLSRAVALNRGLSEAYLMLADIREKRGNYGGAVSALEGYLASGTGVDTVMAEDRIKKLSDMADESK